MPLIMSRLSCFEMTLTIVNHGYLLMLVGVDLTRVKHCNIMCLGA